MYLQRTPDSPVMKIEPEGSLSDGSITGVFRLKEVDKEGIQIFRSVDDYEDETEEPWPEDWVDPYFRSCYGEDEEDEFFEDDDDDDEYTDDAFLDDTGTQIKDAPPLDIL
jgi:hypothetical protein